MERKEMLDRCPRCSYAYLFIRKDFNKPLGCAILIIGALLSPKTMGMSLAVCALIDAILYKRLRSVTICYICAAEFRDAPINPSHKEFDLALDEGYERIREEWKKKGSG
jgi:hypothetical protein